MWDRIEALLERAPHVRALRYHRMELVEARRRRRAGLAPLPELASSVRQAALAELAVPPLLARARAAYDGRLILLKGPEVARHYPCPGLRPFGDLDVLVDDAPAAQRALIAAGFGEIGDPALYDGIHHLRPLAWPGVPVVIEVHSRPKWPRAIPTPSLGELLAHTAPSRLGVTGIETLAPAPHAVLLAAHAWAHEPLARLGHLVDIAATLEYADAGDAAGVARAWGCSRMWRATEQTMRSVLHGEGATVRWARHLEEARERTVLEMHLQRWLAPVIGLPRHRAPAGLARAVCDELRPDGDEPWRAKLSRSRLAVANAHVSRADHDEQLLDARPRC